MSKIDENVFIAIGRLTKDATYRTYGSEGKESSFTVANNRGYGNYEHCNFINCKMHGKRAEALNQYLTKGTMVCIEGEYEQGSYDKDGVKIYTVHIEIHGIQLLGSPSGTGNNQQQTSQPASGGFGAPVQSTANFGGTDVSRPPEKDFDDNIPF